MSDHAFDRDDLPGDPNRFCSFAGSFQTDKRQSLNSIASLILGILRFSLEATATLLCLSGALWPGVRGAGVTIITHGLDGNIDAWITPMAKAIGSSGKLSGANFSRFAFYYEAIGNSYVLRSSLLGGVPPLASDSGESVVELDWSQLADGRLSTTQIAESMVEAILRTDFVPQFGGRSIVELPIHLIGHSRGGSLVAEVARLLGAQGLWVDQMTTLDPHPLNNDGFGGTCGLICDSRAIDGPVRPYVNVLFADNYYQKLAQFVYGESVYGAYNRFLSPLKGGYVCFDPFDPQCWHDYHSNVHLWYHGTIDLRTPITVDGVILSASERAFWWLESELAGINAGFRLTRLGHGDRTSSIQPAGPGTDRIRDGYNQAWDLGAGISANRYALPQNSGRWPNLITLKLAGNNYVPLTNIYGLEEVRAFVVDQGGVIEPRVLYQYGGDGISQAVLRIFLDSDSNPYNPNRTEIQSLTIFPTGTNRVGATNVLVRLNPRIVAAGRYFVYGEISSGNNRRYLYAPEILVVLPQLSLALPRRDPTDPNTWQVRVTGARDISVAVERTTDFQTWTRLPGAYLRGETNSLTGIAEFSDRNSSISKQIFYRALYVP